MQQNNMDQFDRAEIYNDAHLMMPKLIISHKCRLSCFISK